MAGVRTLLTFEEFEQLPDRPGKDELLRGELIQMPPAKRRHSQISKRMFKRLDALLAELHARGDASGLEAVEIETGYRIGLNQWLQPDVSITRTGQLAGEYYEGA